MEDITDEIIKELQNRDIGSYIFHFSIARIVKCTQKEFEQAMDKISIFGFVAAEKKHYCPYDSNHQVSIFEEEEEDESYGYCEDCNSEFDLNDNFITRYKRVK